MVGMSSENKLPIRRTREDAKKWQLTYRNTNSSLKIPAPCLNPPNKHLMPLYETFKNSKFVTNLDNKNETNSAVVESSMRMTR